MSGGRNRRRRRPAGGRGPLLSVCVLARDGSGNLDRCLENLSSLKPEIVIVESASSAGAEQASRRFGARLMPFRWQDDFSAARNLALREARGRWVLVLDDDELIAAEDAPKLRELLLSNRVSAYSMTSRNYSDASNMAGWRACRGEYPEIEGSLPGWFPSARVRLFKRHPLVRFEGIVHETARPSIERLGGRVAACPVPVHHFGLVDAGARKRKARFSLKLCLRKLRSRPDDPGSCFEVASHLFELGRLSWAERAFTRAVELYEALPAPPAALAGIVLQALNMLGVLAVGRGSVEEALERFEEALEMDPSFEPAGRNREGALKRLGRSGPLAQQTHQQSRPESAVTLCMIVKDEEENLPGCLESFGPVADQIVIVDTGSSDSSEAVARSYGAEVYHHPWNDDFSEARNWSLHYARGRTILWVDADDRLEAGVAEKLRRELLAHEGKAVFLVVRSPEPGGNVLRAYQLRAFPNDPEIRFEGAIHEQVIWALERQNIPTVQLPLEILHTGYVDDEALKRKLLRNKKILEGHVVSSPMNIHAQYMLARTLEGLKEHDEAAYWLRRLLDHRDARSKKNEFILHAQALLGVYHANRGEVEEARKLLEGLVTRAPDFAFGRLCAGQVFIKAGRHVEACQVLLPLVEGELKPSLIPTADPVQEAYRYLGAALMGLARWQEARGCLEKALELNPEDVEARFRAGECHLQEGNLEDAERTFLGCDESNPNVLFMLGTVALGRMELDRAEERFAAAASAGLDTAYFHHNFAYLKAQRGDWEDAERHYLLALERQPDMLEALLNMGHGLLCRGRWQEAENFFQRALALDPERLDARLATAALALGRGGPKAHEMAHRLWQDLAPSEQEARPLPSSPSEMFIDLGRILQQQGKAQLSRLCQQLAVSIPH